MVWDGRIVTELGQIEQCCSGNVVRLRLQRSMNVKLDVGRRVRRVAAARIEMYSLISVSTGFSDSRRLDVSAIGNDVQAGYRSQQVSFLLLFGPVV